VAPATPESLEESAGEPPAAGGATRDPAAASDVSPDWIEALIARYRTEPVTNPPRSIWRDSYGSETVYYVPPICCDRYSELRNANGAVLCAPDGGITGRGDGRCPEFVYRERPDRKLVWRDPRNR